MRLININNEIEDMVGYQINDPLSLNMHVNTRLPNRQAGILMQIANY